MLVNEFLENSANKLPDKIALVCENKRYTFSQLNCISNSLGNGFISQGLERQDRVGIYLENSVESVVSIFAALKAGGIFVVINPQVKQRKLEYILNDCQIKILVTDSKHLESISGILPLCIHLCAVIVADARVPESRYAGLSRTINIYSYSDIIEKYPSVQPKKQCIDIDLASLIYTSGSTGNPKGVMLTHLNMATAASSIIEYLENTSNEIILNCLPLSFDYGLYQVLMACKFGGTVILEKAFVYPYQIIDLIAKEKVTGFPIVPTILVILLQLKELNKFDFSSLRYITSTAQALAPKHILRLRELFPHVKIFSMYGLTECKRVSYLHPDQVEGRPTSVGKAMPNTEVWIVDENGEKITQPDQIGELVIRGANVMKGYWNLPEETAKSLKPWVYNGEKILYSGDYFKMDSEGYLYFISRKDDIIKTAGEMVSPKEVENILYDLDGVIEAAVVAVPDEILGNAVKAFVVLSKGSGLTQNEILLHCQKHLENFQVPKFVEFRLELPKTTTGKISKKSLVEGLVVDSL